MPKIVKSKSYKTVQTAMQEWVASAEKLEETARVKYKTIRKTIGKNQSKLTTEQKESLSELIGEFNCFLHFIAHFLVAHLDEIEKKSQAFVCELDSFACTLIDWESDENDESEETQSYETE